MEEKCTDKFEFETAINLSTSSIDSPIIANTNDTSYTKKLAKVTTEEICLTQSNPHHVEVVVISEKQLGKVKFADKPTTSGTSMSSVMQGDYDGKSHNDFAGVIVDDEDEEDNDETTAGILDPYEISSSNLLPAIINDATNQSEPVAIGEDSSSTDGIQIIKVSDILRTSSSHSNSNSNTFNFNSSEVYIINDDEEEERATVCKNATVEEENKNVKKSIMEDKSEVLEEEQNNIMNLSQASLPRRSTSFQLTTFSSALSTSSSSEQNGVIMSTNGTMIFLETPVVEEQHHHIHNHHDIANKKASKKTNSGFKNDFLNTERSVKPKRLSDEFSKSVCDNDEVATSASPVLTKSTTSEAVDVIYDLTESQPGSETHVAHEKMSSRLKNMNLNPKNRYNSLDVSAAASTTQNLANSIPSNIPSTADIESMDLIERQDFENEKHLTGGIILKSSSLVKNNILNLGLAKSHMDHSLNKTSISSNHTNNNNNSSIEEQPTSSHLIRGYSSDSKVSFQKQINSKLKLFAL